MAFIPDAEDAIGKGNEALQKILATTPNRVLKSWQEGELNVPRLPDLYYTSPVGTEPRLYSPGRFAMAIESQVSAPSSGTAPLTVYVRWEVELSKPGLENEADDGLSPVQCPGYLVLQVNSYGLSVKTKKQDGTFEFSTTPTAIFPGMVKGVVYRLPQAVFPYYKAGQTEETVTGNFEFVRWSVETTDKEKNERVWFVESDGTAVESMSSYAQDLLWKPVITPLGENFMTRVTGTEYLSHQENGSGQPIPYDPFESSSLTLSGLDIGATTYTKASQTTLEPPCSSLRKSMKPAKKTVLSLLKSGIKSEDILGLSLDDSDIEILE